jgi:hypothetical protein
VGGGPTTLTGSLGPVRLADAASSQVSSGSGAMFHVERPVPTGSATACEPVPGRVPGLCRATRTSRPRRIEPDDQHPGSAWWPGRPRAIGPPETAAVIGHSPTREASAGCRLRRVAGHDDAVPWRPGLRCSTCRRPDGSIRLTPIGRMTAYETQGSALATNPASTRVPRGTCEGVGQAGASAIHQARAPRHQPGWLSERASHRPSRRHLSEHTGL